MLIQHHKIFPQLQPYIKLICTMDCEDDVDTNHIRVLPDTCVELFVNYTNTPVAIIDNELFKRSIVNSRMNRPSDVQMRKGSGCMAVCFYPGNAYRFFNTPMHLLSNQTFDLHELWKGMASEIENKLTEALNHAERSNIIQNYLLGFLKHNEDDLMVAHCVSKINKFSSHLTVNQLCEDIGLSQRHLSRKFQQFVGVSPKEYLRVSRFIKSLGQLKKHPSLSLTEVAYESGYYDQAHFNHDYKFFTGHTPGQVALSKDILY